MPMYLRKLMARGGYMSPADDEGGAGGGGAPGDQSGAGDDDKAPENKGGTGDDANKGDVKPKPTDEEAKLLKELMSKKTALKDAQAQLDAAKALAAQLEELGGLDSLKELVKTKKDAEQKKLEDKGEWDRLRAQMAEEHTKEIQSVKDAAEAANGENAKLRNTIAELTVGAAFATSPFIKDDLTMPVSKVRALYGSHFEFHDGQIVSYDKPAGASERTMLVDGKGDPLAFEDSIKKIIDSDVDRDQMIKSKTKPGAGSVTTGKGAPPKTEVKTGVDKISAGLTLNILKK